MKKNVSQKVPVRIRTRKLKDGNLSIYLDIYHDGKRSYKYLKLYLVPVKTPYDKAQNDNIWLMAEAMKSKIINRIAEGKAEIVKIDTKTKLSTYWERVLEDSNLKDASKRLHNTAKRVILRYKGDPLLKDIDKDFIKGLLKYLNGGGRCSNTAANYSKFLSEILGKAERGGLIERNPFSLLERAERIKETQPERDFLTIEEVRAIAAAPSHSMASHDTKAAFLFSCFCGLRWSDVEKLKWRDVEEKDGETRVKGKTKKTGKEFNLLLPTAAADRLPVRKYKREPGDAVFRLPGHSSVNQALKKMASDAGIKKRVSFHTARHTYATMLLTKGNDIYTVSKLLGHSKITTTQIYAKVIDEKRDTAVRSLNDIL